MMSALASGANTDNAQHKDSVSACESCGADLGEADLVVDETIEHPDSDLPMNNVASARQGRGCPLRDDSNMRKRLGIELS